MQKQIDFLGKRGLFSVVSIIMVLGSLALIFGKGVEKSVDFAGGTSLTVQFQNEKLEIGTLRDRVSEVDNKATIFRNDTNHGAQYTIKIKNPEVELGKEAEASMARLRSLEAIFAELKGENDDLPQLLNSLEESTIASKLVVENPLNVTGDTEIQNVYNGLAGSLKANAGSAASVQALAEAVRPDDANALAKALETTFPAINRTTPDLMAALLKKHNPLGRDASAGYSDIAQQIVDYRENNKDFIESFDDLFANINVNDGEDLQALKSFVTSTFIVGEYKVISNETFSPSIASELIGKAWGAIILALAGILIYISMRFTFGYAIAAIVALSHDVIIAMGFFSLVGAELSNPVVAAFLTIVGYSLNDTIVVFDRIRENLGGIANPNLEKTMNESINQTLSRTLVTSMTTFLAVAVIYWGSNNATLQDFAFPLLVGIVVGTYSSIFVAAPFLLGYHNRIKSVTT